MGAWGSWTLGLALTGMLALPGYAADIPQAVGGLKDGPIQSWTGFYAGVNAGAAADASGVSNLGISPEHNLLVSTETFYPQFIGGGHAGYSFQRGQWVFGVEGDINAGTDHINYLASIRGRLGYVCSDFLIYATGGAGFIGFDHRVTATDDAGTFHFSKNKNDSGFVAGGGIEKKFWTNWSAGVEGLYYGFGKDNLFTAIPGEPGDFARSSFEPNLGTVRARLSYHFADGYDPLK